MVRGIPERTRKHGDEGDPKQKERKRRNEVGAITIAASPARLVGIDYTIHWT